MDVSVIKDLHAQCDEKFWAFVRFKQEVTRAASVCSKGVTEFDIANIKVILQSAGQHVSKFQAPPSAKIDEGAIKESINVIWKAVGELIDKFRVCRKTLHGTMVIEMHGDCYNVENSYIALLRSVNSAVETALKTKVKTMK